MTRQTIAFPYFYRSFVDFYKNMLYNQNGCGGEKF